MFKYFFLSLFYFFLFQAGNSVLAQKRWHNLLPVNRTDKEGNRHGFYRLYWDDKYKIPMNNGRFKHGKEVGKWMYYDHEGNLQKTERHKKNHILIKEYYPSGKLHKKGKAHFIENEKELHFYYHRDFKIYDERGKWIAIEWYYKGQLMSIEKIDHSAKN